MCQTLCAPSLRCPPSLPASRFPLASDRVPAITLLSPLLPLPLVADLCASHHPSDLVRSPPSPSDLVRAITPLPAILEMDFFKASSYGSGTQTSGQVKLDSGFDLRSIAGKHVLVVS